MALKATQARIAQRIEQNNMKITLQGPYATLYLKGYMRTSKVDGRSRIDLYNSDKDRTTITYAKYIMTIALNRFIDNNKEEVDHIDGNKTNDLLSNLQVITKIEHIEKTRIEKSGKTYFTCVCANCKISFQREARQMHKNSVNSFCSRKCKYEYQTKPV